MKSLNTYIFESFQKELDKVTAELDQVHTQLADAYENSVNRTRREVVPLVKKYYDLFNDAAKASGAKRQSGATLPPYGNYVLDCTRVHDGDTYSFYITVGSFYERGGDIQQFLELAQDIADENSTTQVKIWVEPFDNGIAHIYVTDKKIEKLYDQISKGRSDEIDRSSESMDIVSRMPRRMTRGI